MHRPADLGDDPTRQVGDPGDRIASDDDLEFVAADARDEVLAVDRAADALRRDAEGMVAGGVAKAVVELLEAVEVDREQRQRIAGRVMRLVRARELDDELPAVGQEGERIVGRLPPLFSRRGERGREAAREMIAATTDSARIPSATANAGLSWAIKASVGLSGMKVSVPILRFASLSSVTATRPPLVSLPHFKPTKP